MSHFQEATRAGLQGAERQDQPARLHLEALPCLGYLVLARSWEMASSKSAPSISFLRWR